MSRTRRKDPIDHRAARPTSFISWGGISIDMTPSPKEIRKAHADGKKSHKPGKRAKVYLHKGEKAKQKAAVKRAAKGKVDLEELIVETPPKSDIWDYN